MRKLPYTSNLESQVEMSVLSVLYVLSVLGPLYVAQVPLVNHLRKMSNAFDRISIPCNVKTLFLQHSDFTQLKRLRFHLLGPFFHKWGAHYQYVLKSLPMYSPLTVFHIKIKNQIVLQGVPAQPAEFKPGSVGSAQTFKQNASCLPGSCPKIIEIKLITGCPKKNVLLKF